jgi:hypothetical protein
MPFLPIERGHGVVADHSISVPRLDTPGDRVARDACSGCHVGGEGAEGSALGPERLREAFARWWPDAAPARPWMRALAAARTGDPASIPELRVAAEDESLPPLARASAARLLGRFPDRALPHLLSLLEDPSSLVRRNAAAALASVRAPEADRGLLAALGDPSRAVRVRAARAALEGFERVQANRALLDACLPVLESDARAAPNEDLRWFRLAAAREIAEDWAGAVEAYERQVALDSGAPAARYLPRLRERAAGSAAER